MAYSIVTARIGLILLISSGSNVWAYDPYESRQDREYRALSQSISRAYSAANGSSSSSSYKNSTSSYTSAYSSGISGAPYSRFLSYKAQDPWTWKDHFAETPPRTVSKWDRRLADYEAMRDEAADDADKPAPILSNENALTEHYMSYGLDSYQARREARAEIFRAKKTSSTAANDVAQAEVAYQRSIEAFRKQEARKQQDEIDFQARTKAARTAAQSKDPVAIEKWISLATELYNRWPHSVSNGQEKLDSLEFAAENGSVSATSQAWEMRQVKNVTNPYADSVKADYWLKKLISLSDGKATYAAVYPLLNARKSNFALAVPILEKSYAGKPDGRLAAELSRVYANGDSTLARDAKLAFDWLQKALTQGSFQTDLNYRLEALRAAGNNAELVAAHGPDLLAALQDLRKVPKLGLSAGKDVAEILAGIDKRYAQCGLPQNVRQAKEIAIALVSDQQGWRAYNQWAGRFFYDLKSYELSEIIYDKAQKSGAFGADLWNVGLFWRDRPDGKADPNKAKDALSKAAGDLAHGGYLMAEMYFEGNGFRKDTAHAIEWLRWGVKKDQASSMFRLARAYIFGEGVERNPTEARELIKRGLKDGWIGESWKDEAGFDLVLLNNQERLAAAKTPMEKQEAMKLAEGGGWFYALKGVKAARALWCEWILTDHIDETAENHATALELVRQDALEKNPRATYLLGSAIYTDTLSKLNVKKIDRDEADLAFREATDLLEAADQLGSLSAARGLAVIYRDGRGRKPEKSTAIQWFEKALAQGDTAIVYMLADLYLESGATQNHARAMEILEAADKRGDALAQNMLGVVYLKGMGVTADSAKAIGLFDKAVAGGQWQAARNRLKVCYLGMGITATPTEALAKFEASLAGMGPQDWYLTGLLYANDPHVGPFLPKPDLVSARKWLTKAAEAGHEEAKKELLSLK